MVRVFKREGLAVPNIRELLAVLEEVPGLLSREDYDFGG